MSPAHASAATLKLLKPGAHSRKAIYGAAVAFFTALAGAAKSGGISFVETIGIVGATVLGYLAVWAGVNEPKNKTGINDSGLTTMEFLMILTFLGVVILLAALVF